MSTKSRKDSAVTYYTFSTGYKVVLKPVPQLLLQSSANSVKTPPIPTWEDENGREQPYTPDSQPYIDMMAEVEQQRNEAIVNATLLLGVKEVTDGEYTLESKEWLDNLKWMAEQSIIEDITSKYDLDSNNGRRLVFLRFVVMGTDEDFALLTALTRGIDEVQVKKVLDSFRDNALARINSNSSVEESPIVSE